VSDITGPVPPRTPYEEIVAAIWRDVLGRPDVGVLDDFFDLGGHSLLAVQVAVRIRKTLGADVPVKDLFETPTVTALAAAAAAASGTSPSRPDVTPRQPGAEPVLSFDQQRLWLESQLRPAAAYNVHGRRRLTGNLSVEALERSLRAILIRHEALRTRFPLVDGRPIQLVDEPDEEWRISFEDLSGTGTEPDAADRDAADRDAAARRLADEHAAAPFDLANGPLFRCLLVRLGETEHLLSITMHHIVSDAWSVGLLLREVSALYRADGDLSAADLPPLPVQYRDYAVWQREWLAGADLEADLSYWRGELAGAPPALALPVARRRSPSQGVTGGRVRSSLPEAETAALRGLCRKHGVTLFMTLLATLAAVLRRWSGQEDVVIGVPVTTRNDAGTSLLIGFFVNTLPLRVDLSGNPAFAELLRRVRRVALDGYAHCEAPFDLLVRELRTPRDPTRTPLFQVVLNMLSTGEENSRIDGLSVQDADAPVLPSKFDLMLNVRESRSAVDFELAFHEDRYDAETMRVLLRQFGALLRAVAADPDRSVLEFPLEDPGQAAVTPAAAAPAPTPHLAVQDHAVSSPGRVAIIDGAGQWTYRQLSLAVRNVADALARPEHGKTAQVGVVARRSAGFAAAILGCIRAGMPFSVVGTATAWPGITTMLDPDEIGTAPGGAASAPGGADTDELWAHEERTAQDWALGRFDLSRDDRFAVLSSSPAHMTSALCSALSAGAVLAVPDHATVGDIGSLVGWLESERITVVYLNPPLLRALAAHDPVPRLPLLRYAFTGNDGELISQDVAALNRISPSCRCVAVYGMARTGQPLAFYEVAGAWHQESAPLRIPLGTTGDGPQATLLNAAGQPAATGEVGEICSAAMPTGDLGRRLPDGTLERSGRAPVSHYADPAETVAALRDVPGVRDAIVTEYLDVDGRATLTAYIAARDQLLSIAKLRQHLVTQLPEYLVPQHFVVLDQLPLTADGDYDLSVLPVPGYDLELADSYVAPRTPMEGQLTEIFEELLGLDRVGIHDTFFELNGFSLLANQLAARIRETFQCQLSLRDVFQTPTVEGLAQLITRARAELVDAGDLEALLAEVE
jgi:non-ribosomal peptide synthetase component F/acyl carrier protein